MIRWRLRNRSILPIGLDIGNDSIKMIQLVAEDGNLSVIAADKVCIACDIEEDTTKKRDFIVSAIKQMLKRGNFQKRKAVSFLPVDKLKLTSLRVADAENGQIEQFIRKEVSMRFGLDPDRDLVNYLLAGNVLHGDEIKNELILFAADNKLVENHIIMLEEAGLVPVAIDTVPCALFRSFERSLRRQEDLDRTAVFVDVGKRFTTVVLGRGQEICFVKQIPIAGANFDEQIVSRLGVTIDEAERLRRKLRLEESAETALDPSSRQVVIDAITAVAETLAKEISLCFKYYTVTFRGKQIERAIFSGGESYEEILLNVLNRQLGVEIELAEPLRGFDISGVEFDGCRRGLFCEWSVAVGLGLKGLKEEAESLICNANA
ncbi:MAG: pilus assembly protein PilM [Planctomycetota bacterium]